jgi:Tfp pilus assembly protein PilF
MVREFKRFGQLMVMMFLCSLIGCSQNPPITAPPQNTESARAQNNAAYKLIQQGKYPEAEDILKNALVADVMFGPARNNLGLVYFKQKKLYQAAWEFENAVKLMPHQPEIRNNLGMVLEEAGKLREAGESYTRALEMEPDNAVYIGNLAKVRIRQRVMDEQTRKLLDDLVYKDTRPEWVNWAKEQLLHFPKNEDVILLPGGKNTKG